MIDAKADPGLKFAEGKLNESKKGQLYFTVGLPRSGKSTVARNWMMEKPGRTVLCADSFRLALHGRDYIQEAEGIIHPTIEWTAKALLIAGQDVLLDETNTRKERREKWQSLGGIGMYVPTPLSVCLGRVDKDNIPLIDAIKRMNENLKDFNPKNENISIIIDRSGIV